MSRAPGSKLLPNGRVVVLGIGNPLAGDDGAGVVALELLRQSGLPSEVELVDGGTLGLWLLSALCEARYVIVLDAYRSGRPPGTVSVVDLEALSPLVGSRVSMHEAGVLDLLRGAELVGKPLSGVLIGIEPEQLTPGEWGLSPAVRAGLPELLEAVITQLRSLGFEATAPDGVAATTLD